MKAIKNVKIIEENEVIEGKALLYDKKILKAIPEGELKLYYLEEIIDGGNCYISPGFIDIHIHGCAGFDTMDAAFESLNTISRKLTQNGVTAFLATTMTAPRVNINKALDSIRQLKEKVEGAHILGAHLEGPFINPKYKGAHDEKYIILPETGLIEEYKDVIKLVTIAPELEGSARFIERCRELNVGVSMGHSGASLEEATAAIENGAGSATHIFNAMIPFNHRNPGLIGAALLKDIYCEIIADNIHVNPEVYKLLYSLKSGDRIVLITDAMMGCMLSDGKYKLGGLDVDVADGAARLMDGTLAGSTLRINMAIRNFMQGAGLDICEAVKMATLNPARLLRIDKVKGHLKEGFDADMTVFDENLKIKFTIVEGRTVYKSE